MILMILKMIFLFKLFSMIHRHLEVSDLNGESSFRMVKLNWNFYNEPDPIGFIVRFCELSVWQTNVRCKERLLRLNNGRIRNKANQSNKLNSSNEPLNGDQNSLVKQSRQLNAVANVQTYDKLIRKNKHFYEAFIYDLRTLTNYTFMVTAEQFDHSTQSISTSETSIQNIIKQNLKDKTQMIKTKKPSLSTGNTNLDDNLKSIQIETKGCKFVKLSLIFD